jgi:hypothetical protein
MVGMSFGLVSFASHADVEDNNDTRGPLDVRTVRMSAGNSPRWTFSTFDRWRATEIWDSGFFVVKLDTFGDERFDYFALIRSVGDRLDGSLYRDYRRKDDKRKTGLRVGRPNRRSALVTVPLSRLRFTQRGVFRWTTTATWTSARCGRATCLDRAPDRGAVDEPRGVPTPTITTSPTATP